MLNLRKKATIGLSLASIAGAFLPIQAQALIKFTSEYDFFGRIVLVPEKNLLIGPGEAVTKGAPFGLNSFTSLVYSDLTEAVNAIGTNGTFRYYSDSATLGLNEPSGGITFFGEGDDKIFGSLNGIDIVDSANLTAETIGDIVIKGGAGRFENATGFGTVVGIVGSDPSIEINPGRLVVNLSIEAPKSIPENTSLVGISVAIVGAGFVLKKKYRTIIG